VSNTVSLEPVTCASCEYRYPSSERSCPMCGTELLRPLLVARKKSSRARDQVRTSSENKDGPPWPRLPRLKFAVVALMALTAVTSLVYKSSKGPLAKESGASAKLTATSGQPKPENAGERDIAHDPVGGVQGPVVAKLETAQAIDTARENDAAAKPLAPSERIKIENAAERHIVPSPIKRVQNNVTAKVRTAQTTNPVKENDPVELWKAIRRGSVSAEVTLANLYLEGETVPQNCEQAHMLLRAASMKGSKAADNLLRNSYAERCE
jgi:hypothetical protein